MKDKLPKRCKQDLVISSTKLDNVRKGTLEMWKKLPSCAGKPFQGSSAWIKDKCKDDDIGSLWRVHDGLYDLTPFIDQHPGGSVWLSLTQGTDVTEAFESSHFLNMEKVDKTLRKYYVAPSKGPRVSPYTLDVEGFYRVLKKRVEPILRKTGTGPTFYTKLWMDFLVFAYFDLLFACGVAGKGIVGQLGLPVLTGLLLTLLLSGAHNFVHGKENWRRLYFDLGLLSSHDFRVTHCLSHHLFPNTHLDAEMILTPTFDFRVGVKKKESVLRTAKVMCHFWYALGHWAAFKGRLMSFLGTGSFRWENGLVLVQLLFLSILKGGMWEGLWTWALIHTSVSYFFNFQGINAGHYDSTIFCEGDAPRPAPDFGLCQLDATRERSDEIYRNRFIGLLTFGEHPLHHLFPTVDYFHLPKLKGVVLKTLGEFNENYPPLLSQSYLWKGLFEALARTEPHPPPPHPNYVPGLKAVTELGKTQTLIREG